MAGRAVAGDDVADLLQRDRAVGQRVEQAGRSVAQRQRVDLGLQAVGAGVHRFGEQAGGRKLRKADRTRSGGRIRLVVGGLTAFILVGTARPTNSSTTSSHLP